MTPEELERKHFQHVIHVFLSYKEFSLRQVDRKARCLSGLPEHHRKMVPTQFERIPEWKKAIETNHAFLTRIVEHTSGMFVNSDIKVSGADSPFRVVSADDIDRVRTTIKQCVRDWSQEGAQERANTYKLITDELEILYPISVEAAGTKTLTYTSTKIGVVDRSRINVLVPGAGLGRLMHDIARLGFSCQGNEFSLFMLFASNYILNTCTSPGTDTIHPWLHQTVNVVRNDDQVRSIRIPDINPQELNGNPDFSMSAGDFLEVYTEPEKWDVVAMSFFLDTAHNVIKYIERAHFILRPGGYLIHLGPLLYHFADIEKEPSVELTYEEIKTVLVEHFKFRVVKEELNVKSSYIRNVRSMFTMVYDCAFLVLQKT